MNLKTELEKIIHNVGPENIWRPIYDNEDILLADGIADMLDGYPEDLSKINFHGKTVLDLGCNFGFYSFLAKRLGARKVVGIDINDQIIKGCKLLKAMHGVKDVYFYSEDFTTANLRGEFDIGMLINFIGKKSIRKGIQKVLDAVERFSSSGMVISARPYYHISRHLGVDPEDIIRHYPTAYVKNDRFKLMDFVHDYFCDNWEMSIVSSDYDDRTVKRTLYFTRR